MPKDLFEQGVLGPEIVRRERMWRPRHKRMDFWLACYLLYDAWQDNKPLGERRFVSNEPETIIDTVHRILTRFPISWWIAVDEFEKTDDATERLYGNIERALYGFMADINEDMLERGEQTLDKGAAYFALLYGMIATKIHLTERAQRPSGIVAVNYDPRFVLPAYDGVGLSSVIAMTPITFGELQDEYPETVGIGTNSNASGPDQMCMKIEVWDRVNMGVAYSIGANHQSISGWCIPKQPHGFFGPDGKYQEGRLNKLPFVIQDVNGLPIKEKPSSIYMTNNGLGATTPQELRKMATIPGYEWRSTRVPIAERGRSILAPIEKHIFQFNEAVATIWQNFSIDTFGVYFLANRGGRVTQEQQTALGSGALIGIERGDAVQRFNPSPVSPAAIQFLQVITDERQKGTIAPVLQAMSEFRSGFQQARMEQTALNAIEPFLFGQKTWASRVGQLIIDQLVMGKSTFNKPMNLRYAKDTGAGQRTFFRIEFDPNELRNLKDKSGKSMRVVVGAEIEPALPTDMLERAQIANLLTNNRRPLLSRSTVQERILRIQDPARENERIWDDVASTDPVVVMMEIADALERQGKMNIAQLFRQRENSAMLMEMLRNMQVQGLLGQAATPEGIAGLLGGGNGGAGGAGGAGDQGDRGSTSPSPLESNPAPSTQPPEMRNEGREATQAYGGAQ